MEIMRTSFGSHLTMSGERKNARGPMPHSFLVNKRARGSRQPSYGGHRSVPEGRCSDMAYRPQLSRMDVTAETPPPSLCWHSFLPYLQAATARTHFECLVYLNYSELPKDKQLYCEWGNEKNFSCKYCEKQYSSLGALKIHMRTHTLPCVCELCGKTFSRPWLLQGYIRTLTGEKPFPCLHCSQAFADRSNLRAHLQTHSDLKKYQCARCYRTFSRISLLARHQESSCPLS